MYPGVSLTSLKSKNGCDVARADDPPIVLWSVLLVSARVFVDATLNTDSRIEHTKIMLDSLVFLLFILIPPAIFDFYER